MPGRLVDHEQVRRPRRRSPAAAPRRGRRGFPSVGTQRRPRSRWPARTRCAALRRRRAPSTLTWPPSISPCRWLRENSGGQRDEHLVEPLAVQRASTTTSRRSTPRLRGSSARRRVASMASSAGSTPYNRDSSFDASRRPRRRHDHECPCALAGVDRSVGDLAGAAARARGLRLDAEATSPRLAAENDCTQRPRKRPRTATTRRADQALRAPRRPRRRHGAGAAGAARARLHALEDRREGAGAVDARALHQAAPDQPGARLRALPAGPDQLQRQPRPASASLARQDLSERDQQASRDSYQSFKQLDRAVPAVAVRRGCARCA